MLAETLNPENDDPLENNEMNIAPRVEPVNVDPISMLVAVYEPSDESQPSPDAPGLSTGAREAMEKICEVYYADSMKKASQEDDIFQTFTSLAQSTARPLTDEEKRLRLLEMGKSVVKNLGKLLTSEVKALGETLGCQRKLLDHSQRRRHSVINCELNLFRAGLGMAPWELPPLPGSPSSPRVDESA